MKRALVLILVLALPAAFTLPAAAKIIFLFVAANSSGAFFVGNKVFNKAGDCGVVATLFVYKGLKKTRYGMVKAITRAEKICCKAQTYQITAIRYAGADFKPLHSEKVPPSLAKIVKAKPGTMRYDLVKKVCSPGFPQ